MIFDVSIRYRNPQRIRTVRTPAQGVTALLLKAAAHPDYEATTVHLARQTLVVDPQEPESYYCVTTAMRDGGCVIQDVLTEAEARAVCVTAEEHGLAYEVEPPLPEPAELDPGLELAT